MGETSIGPQPKDYQQFYEKSPTTQTLLADNRSEQARLGREQWVIAKLHGTLTVFDTCSDSRTAATDIVVPDDVQGIVDKRSIAAANIHPDSDPFAWLYNHPAVSKGVVIQHFDGAATLPPGEYPSGCGGLIEKKRIMNRPTAAPRDIREAIDYVEAFIDHWDIVEQVVKSAARVSKITGNQVPVLAGVFDHRSRKLHVVAIFQGGSVEYAMPAIDYMEGNLEEIYKNGIPSIDLAFRKNPFEGIIAANQRLQAQFAKLSPEEQVRLAVQSPRTAVLTTEIRPLGIRYPHHFGAPGTAFAVDLPFYKHDGSCVDVKPDRLQQAIAQLTYSLGHATNAQPGQSFYVTDTVIVETPDNGLTQNVVQELERHPVVLAWKKAKNGTILAAEVKRGETTQIHEV